MRKHAITSTLRQCGIMCPSWSLQQPVCTLLPSQSLEIDLLMVSGVQASCKAIIPQKTESIRDHKIMNDDNAIPMCTLKGAPYEATHCIEWAIHDETDGSLNKLFKLLPSGLHQYLEDQDKYLNEMDLEKATEYKGYKEKLDFITHALKLGDVDSSFARCPNLQCCLLPK